METNESSEETFERLWKKLGLLENNWLFAE